ncbi:MAG TPA: phage holin family protein [Chitinophagales bacterium]|nr:phage holin family protein [Chitinophagales bacterium]
MTNFILKLLVNALAVLITSYLIPGVRIESPAWSILIAVVLVLMNTIVKPIMIILTLPATLFTFGLFILVINAFVILLTSKIVPGFTVESFWSALGFSIILSIIQSVFEATAQREER